MVSVHEQGLIKEKDFEKCFFTLAHHIAFSKNRPTFEMNEELRCLFFLPIIWAGPRMADFVLHC
jgi:hypothetical protein